MSINEEALLLNPLEKIQLIDELLLSLDIPNHDLDKIWAEEAENRIQAYDTGLTKATKLEDILAKYKNDN